VLFYISKSTKEPRAPGLFEKKKKKASALLCTTHRCFGAFEIEKKAPKHRVHRDFYKKKHQSNFLQRRAHFYDHFRYLKLYQKHCRNYQQRQATTSKKRRKQRLKTAQRGNEL
jgi:hypothetical protein